MDKVTPEFVAELKELIAKHNVHELDVPTTIGQALNAVQNVCASNCLQWALLGLAADELTRKNVAGILKAVACKYDNKHLNYNDLDDNVWGAYVKWPIECLECSSIISDNRGKDPTIVAACKRCSGTGKDPQFYEEAWIVVADMHGNGFAFVVYENCRCITVHFRELPYNKPRNSRKLTLKKLSQAVQAGRYDSKEPMLCCHDSRDKGFVLSVSVEKDDGRIDGEANGRFTGMMSLVCEHFPCLLDGSCD